MRGILGSFLALVAAATLVACSGDDDDAGSSSTAVTEVRDDSASASSGPTSLPPFGLRDILDRQENAVVEVAYQRGDDEFTIAQDRDRKSIRSGDSLSIFEGTRTIDCTNLEAEPSCVELDPDVSSIASVGLTFYDLIGRSLSTVADTTPPPETTREVVAGRPAMCFEGDATTFLAELSAAVGPVPSATVHVCVDRETGYLLSYRNDSDPADDLVATEVGPPSASAFEPPVEVGSESS